jgi:FkbM family methyltransferase
MPSPKVLVQRLWAKTPFAPKERVRAYRGLEIVYDPRTDVGAALRLRAFFEERLIDAAAAMFVALYGDEDRAVVDVGANIGTHALVWAQALPGTPVFAIEPTPATQALLRRNVERNGKRDQIRILPYAASNADGEAEFFLTADDAYNSMVDSGRKRRLGVIRVPARRLDTLAAEALEGRRVGLLKIDVEGAEPEVLEGARALLHRDRPILFLEVWGSGKGRDPDAIVQSVRDLGYRSYVYTERGLVRSQKHDDRHYNYFFLPRR